MRNTPDIPGYKIEEKLGEGEIAGVYVGVQENWDQRVAIKILDPRYLKNREAAGRFLREAEAVMNLLHPNIVTVYHAGRVKNLCYLMMEYLEETLRQRIRPGQGIGSSSQTLDIIKRVAGALDHAHRRGVIHRDVKPENIMFRADGTPVLVDFGLARVVYSEERLTRTDMAVGTPRYMSPEQIEGQEIDGRSDVYSLGVVFYEMLLGDVPYKDENYFALATKHLTKKIPRLPRRLKHFQPLLDRMMAKEGKERPQGAALIDLITELQDSLKS